MYVGRSLNKVDGYPALVWCCLGVKTTFGLSSRTGARLMHHLLHLLDFGLALVTWVQ